MRFFLFLVLTAGVGAVDVFAAQHHQRGSGALAPGYGELEFELAAPGSYTLPVLWQAADSRLVDSKGDLLTLYDLISDKFTLLSFIYTSCSDVNGCPLASYVMSKVQRRVMKDEVLKDYVRLVSFSFDPENDTPEVLEQYAGHFRQPGSDWHFVTADSAAALEATLEAYDQFVIREYDQDGKLLGSISHMLRVYLIDHNRGIRNIYSVSYLHPDTVINDIRTIVGDSIVKNAAKNVAGN